MVGSFALSFAAVDILLERMGLGPAPFPFEVPHVGRTERERAGIRAAVLTDLARRGLAEEAEAAVLLFTRSWLVITAFGKLDGNVRFFARVCGSEARAVLATGGTDHVHFERIRPTAVVSHAVGLLPVERAGTGRSVTISADAAPPERRVTRTVRGGADVRRAHAMLERTKLRLGQFRVTVNGRHEPDVFWFDTAVGRYSVTSRTADDGRVWTTISPADGKRIAQLLTAQLASLTRCG